MAMKVTLVAALLVTLVAFASATTYSTTVTTVTVDDETNPGQQEHCRQQLQGRKFRPCQRYISQRSSPYEGVLEMTTDINPREDQEQLEECCQKLRKVSKQCQCEAIKQAVRQVQQQEGESQQMREVYERASELPRTCSLQTEKCEIRVVFV